MLIRTQDQMCVCNLDNMQSIVVNKTRKENSTNYIIRIHFANTNYCDLGIYKTQERAMQVLDKICSMYELDRNGIYQMPEE